eukprot:m.275970 g.275970  ORF g.275970 m.275970 type:complete len:112 (+) comp15703_c0_seq5:52-387(+)
MRLIIALPLMLLCCAAPTSGDYLVVIESAIVPDNGTYSVSVQWTYETDTTQPSLGPDPVFNHTVPLPANKVRDIEMELFTMANSTRQVLTPPYTGTCLILHKPEPLYAYIC